MTETRSVAIVSGAAGNVGSALVRLLVGQGVRVVAIDRAVAPVQAVLDGLPPGGHLALAGVDLMDAAACEAAVARVLAEMGRLDMVGHTVGGFAYAPIAEAPAAMFQQMLQINLFTTLNLYRAALGPMRAAGRGGSLVGIGAMAGIQAGAGVAAYAAAKSAVLRLTESLAAELKPEGVRVNAVLPGTIDTPQNRAAMADADTARWVTPEQVAAAMGFLLGEAASGVTGAFLPVTGRG